MNIFYLPATYQLWRICFVENKTARICFFFLNLKQSATIEMKMMNEMQDLDEREHGREFRINKELSLKISNLKCSECHSSEKLFHHVAFLREKKLIGTSFLIFDWCGGSDFVELAQSALAINF